MVIFCKMLIDLVQDFSFYGALVQSSPPFGRPLPPLPRVEFMKGHCFVLSNLTRAPCVTVTGRHTKLQPWMKRASIAGFLDIYRRLTLRVLDGFSIESYEKKRR